MVDARGPLRIFWIDAPELGRIAVMPRPMPDQFAELKAAGVDCVVSLLEDEEANHLGLGGEAGLARAAGMDFLQLPVVDHDIPQTVAPVEAMARNISARLKAGKGVAVHCYAGLGRSPLLIAAVLIDNGVSAVEACDQISAARGIRVPETDAQFRWLQAYAQRRQ